MVSKAMQQLNKITGEKLSFGSMLRTIRENKDMDQEEFGAILGISKGYLGDIERGRANVTIDQAIKFAAKLEDSQEVFIKLAIENKLDEYGLHYEVGLTPKNQRVIG